MTPPEVDEARCKACGACIENCPEKVMQPGEEGAAPIATEAARCISCGQCVALCPTGAIAHEDFPEGNIQPIQRELLPSAEQLTEILRSRRSTRVFLPRPVERELIERVIEAAHHAPTAHNSRSTRYTVIRDEALLAKIVEETGHFYAKLVRMLKHPIARTLFGWYRKHELEAALPMLPSFEQLVADCDEGQDSILRGAPCLLVFHGDPSAPMADRNAQLALQNATLLAETLGLASFYTGFIVGACERDRKLTRLMNIPHGQHVYAGLAIGYPKYTFRKWVARGPAEVNWL